MRRRISDGRGAVSTPLHGHPGLPHARHQLAHAPPRPLLHAARLRVWGARLAGAGPASQPTFFMLGQAIPV